MNNAPIRGFTLAELAVVLVLIGALTGGILYGRTLLMASQLQTVVTDLDSYISATANFKQSYQALPGDLPTAETLWGTDSNGCSYGGGNSGTCNGNGDGAVGSKGGAYPGQDYEIFRFWQHLYYAGMFSKRLNGVSSGATDTTYATLNVNTPAGSVDGSGWTAITKGTATGSDSNVSAGFYGFIFEFGSVVSGSMTRGGILTPMQAASIDAKIDDGVPSTGKVRAPFYNASIAPDCTTSGGAYNVTDTLPVCSFYFLSGF